MKEAMAYCIIMVAHHMISYCVPWEVHAEEDTDEKENNDGDDDDNNNNDTEENKKKIKKKKRGRWGREGGGEIEDK
jgi:hypothetical protein